VPFAYNLFVIRRTALLLLTLWSSARAADRVPGVEWERIPKPEDAGYSSAKLEALRAWLKTEPTKAMMAVVGGRVLFEYGDVKYVSKIASERKSILAMLFGNYVASGKVNLRATVKEIGLDDLQPFLPIEEHATLEMLLTARSGIYHPAGETDVADEPPRRGSQYPGAFFDYNAWDFNAAGTAFEKLTGKNIYDALESDLAKPLGMQDFDRARQKKYPAVGRETEPGKVESIHPEYAMYLSTRDMARLGLLMLRDGEWNGKRLMPDHWTTFITTLVTPASELFPSNIKAAFTTGPARWGYGALWWVWDQPKHSSTLAVGPFDGAYTALGTGGQFLTVLPQLDMVVSHKVEIEGPTAQDMQPLDSMTILQMLIAAKCTGPCK
jgi:CubicO group peptidase (beta-lactamase class C family)